MLDSCLQRDLALQAVTQRACISLATAGALHVMQGERWLEQLQPITSKMSYLAIYSMQFDLLISATSPVCSPSSC